MFRKLIGALILSIAVGGLQVARADTFNEIGDAGELLGTAQNASVSGSLDAISGNLSNLGGLDDVDLYRIFISSPAAFSVTVSSSLSIDDDARLYLFNSTGNQVLFDDDSGGSLRPRIFAGDLSGAPGVYYLAYELFETVPLFTGGVLSGWDRNPAPFQTGPYTLTLTGAASGPTPPSTVPEPSTIALVMSGIGMLSLISRKRLRG